MSGVMTSPVAALYEDVDSMTFNPQYVATKLQVSGHSDSGSAAVSAGDIASTMTCTDRVGDYAMINHPTSHAGTRAGECDTYELMKPSGSVRMPAIDTADNVCYHLD